MKPHSATPDLLPDLVEPMKAKLVGSMPPGDWIYEIKFDGYRALALRGGSETECGAGRKESLVRFGSTQEAFKAVIPASCVLSKEEGWTNRTLTVSGLISFYAQAPAMRILEKSQIALLEE